MTTTEWVPAPDALTGSTPPGTITARCVDDVHRGHAGQLATCITCTTTFILTPTDQHTGLTACPRKERKPTMTTTKHEVAELNIKITTRAGGRHYDATATCTCGEDVEHTFTPDHDDPDPSALVGVIATGWPVIYAHQRNPAGLPDDTEPAPDQA